MRVTQNMMSNNMLRNMQQNLRSMEKIQHQMASGKKMRRPADDPANLVNALRNRTQRTEIDKYKGNVGDGLTWMENIDAALGETGNVMHRVREITVRGANDTYSETDFKAMADEIRQLRDHLVQVANTKVGDRHIFAGTDTLNSPAVINGDGAVEWEGNSKDIEFEIGQGVKVPINVDGGNVFGIRDNDEASATYGEVTEDIFGLLDELADKLSKEDFDPDIDQKAVSEYLGEIDKFMDNILTTRADVGARVNRLDHTQSWLTDLNINLTDLSSKMEDVDMAEAITHFTNFENVYRASLATGARTIQPTLVDFLR
ncbi:flagellar hook-associated protein 3 FlgL [Desulfitispora alkaliphila]|uniref:flagellar hook-associated protein FlgL n=1 Tax=Desulfitispora alkaliphila TaxID=622674 RepID=UPI003D1FE7CC